MAINCDTFKEKLNLYMDSELSPAEHEKMDQHARECPECGLLLDQATQLATLCAEMDEGLTVPLAAQSAWRKAVRAECDKKKRTPIGAWTRGLAAVAAALVVLVGGTYGMRGTQPASAYLPPAAGADTARQTRMTVQDATEDTYSLMTRPLAVSALRADGNQDPVAERSMASKTIAAESVLQRSARREIRSIDYESDCVWLDNLVSEYDAYYGEHTVLDAQENSGRVLNAVICVPEDALDSFLMELNQLGETTLESISLEDVTARLLRTKARIDALTEQETRLTTRLASAETTEDALAIEKQLTETRSQLQALTAESISYCRVTLTLTEATAASTASTSAETLTGRMKTGFDASVEWLKHFGEDALVTLATAAPRLVVWIPALVLIGLLLRLICKRRK